jgi:adenine/guanine phosphoribosyltransferase-like PRPP-binding protein
MRELPLRFVGSAATLDTDALLREPDELRDDVYAWLSKECATAQASIIIGLESWGYLLAAPAAVTLGVGLVAARRRVDRLSSDALIVQYDMNNARGHQIGLERTSRLAGNRVALVDDSAVSGSTIEAVADIVTQLGGEVAVALTVTGSERVTKSVKCYKWLA